tara:strand:+ start:298 stop:609 length:312 start_codon:yes stop_codon:yes gene_type:complete
MKYQFFLCCFVLASIKGLLTSQRKEEQMIKALKQELEVTSQLEKDLEDKGIKKWVNSIDNLEEKLEEIIEDNLEGSKSSRKLNNDELKIKERFLKKIIKNNDI